MSNVAQTLRERRANVWEQAKALADRASDENRAFSGEEEGQWATLNAELDALDRRIKAVIDGEQRAKDAEDAMSKLRGEPRGQGGPDDKRGDKNDELRKFLCGESGRFMDINPSGPVDFRSLVKSGATTGGNTVPTSFYDRLVAHLIETSGMLQTGPTVLNTTSGENVQIPKTTAHSSGAIMTPNAGEGATIPTSDPAFGQVTLGAYKYGMLIQVSRELLTDTGVDLEGYLAMQAGRALGNAFGAHMVTGTGTNQPRGVVTDATSGATGETVAQMGTGSVVGGVSYGPLVDLQYSVIAPYRSSSSCYWLMKDSTVGALRKLRDSTGQPIWQPSVQAGAPDLLLGKPLVTDPNVAAIGSAAKSILFGDFSQYFVRMSGGIRFERSDDFAFNTDLVTFRALLRADAALVDLTGAVKFFTGGTV